MFHLIIEKGDIGHMTDFIYIVLILLLIGGIYYLYQQNQNALKQVNAEKGEQHSKIESLNEVQSVKSNEIHNLKNENEELARKHEHLEETLNYVKNTNKNKGEMMAAKQLEDMFADFKDKNLLSFHYIYNNILIYNGREPRQIDHLIVCDKGLYLIETKCWEGDIYYNVSREALEKNNMNILNRYVFNDDVARQYKTFVLKTNDKGFISYKEYGHPYNQIWDTIKVLKKELDDALQFSVYINGIVYFNYESNGKYTFMDGTAKNTRLKVANQKENLQKRFEEDFKKINYPVIPEEKFNEYLEVLDRYVL